MQTREATSAALSRRRMLLSGGATIAAGALMGGLPADAADAPAPDSSAPAAQPGTASAPRSDTDHLPPGQPGQDYTPVITPNNISLPWKVVDGVKVYHLVAEEMDHQFAPGLHATCWGFNGHVHGPTVEAVEGDRVRVYVTNRLPAPTSIHWHGMLVPNGMDGVGGLTQRAIRPGETFRYEFTLRQHGTYMYHSHHDEMTQMALGLMGMVVIHPRGVPPERRVDRDFAILLSEWRILPGTSRPDPNTMTDFNVLTMNARAFPGTEPLVVRTGQRVRIRFGNLGAMDHHPIHLHNYSFQLVSTDGGDVPPSARKPESTVFVPVGTTRTIELLADAPGDWAVHCHMTHHVMNQMGHDVPNLIGVRADVLDRAVGPLLPQYMTMGQEGMGEHGRHAAHMGVPANSIPMLGAEGPFDYITMGGMFTILKVRDGLTSYEDPGWYQHPPGTVAEAASAEELRRDGIDVSQPTTAPSPVAPPPSHGDHSHHGHADAGS